MDVSDDAPGCEAVSRIETIAVAASCTARREASAQAGEVSGGLRDLLGPLYDPPAQFPGMLSHRPRPSLDSVRHWNEIAIDASGIDHSGFGEQFGPTRASRAMAIVHIAVFEAVNAIAGGYRSYAGL